MVPTGVGFKCTTCTRSLPSRRELPPWSRPVAVAALVAMAGLAALTLLGGEGPDSSPDPAIAVTAGGPIERRVQIDGAGDVVIGGTLALPEAAGTGDTVSGVVIIPGFGPTTRDGVVPSGTVPDNLYSDLSATLVGEGMATFRYDKRGTGQSVLPPDEPLRFDDMVADAAAAVSFMAERAEVDPQSIAVVGHEEGGLVALQLAASESRVGRLVLVSVPGRPLIEVLSDDFNNSGHGDEVATLQAVVGGLLAGQGLPEQGQLPPLLQGFFPAAQEGYLQELFALDPVTVASRVDTPVLIVRGGAATGVSAADSDALAAALGSHAEVVVAPGAGPTLRAVEAFAGEDSSNPMSSAHEHGASAPTVTAERDQDAMTAIADFLTET